MRKLVAAFVTLVALLATFPAHADDAAIFERVVSFATKTGFRGVVAWQADRPVKGEVRWGTEASTLDRTVLPFANLVDRSQIATLEGLTRESTVYFKVVDTLTGAATPVHALQTVNAYTDFDTLANTYTVDVIVQADAPLLGSVNQRDLSLEEVAAGVNVLAERVWDATDGWVRIGKAIVTDTALNHPANVPARGTVCAAPSGYPVGGTAADFLIETSVPFDSHTWGGWMIDNACTGFYIGRLGQLVVRWTDDLHLGYVMAHEFMHYAFNSPDLYSALGSGGCANPAWDGSIMHNSGGYDGGRWRLTELDRNAELTPCDHSSSQWSWQVLRQRYDMVPPPVKPDATTQRAKRGNPDGSALEIYIMQQLPGMSTLTPYVPVDTP